MIVNANPWQPGCAGRASPRFHLSSLRDAARLFDPCCLRAPLALRRSVLRTHRLRGLRPCGSWPASTRCAHGWRGATLSRLRRAAGRAVVLGAVSVVVPLSLIALQSRPSLLSRSRAAGLDRPASRPAMGHASRLRLRHILGCASGIPRLRNPGCHAPLLQPETLPAPYGALPALRFLRRLRRTEPSRKGEQA